MFLYKNEEMPQQKTNTVTQTAGLENQEILENVKAIFTYFRMTLKNGFHKCSLFVLSANGWKDQNMDSSFSLKIKA